MKERAGATNVSTVVTVVAWMMVLLWAGAASMAARQATSAAPAGDAAKRGAYLVNAMGCHDCHTPHKMGASGPEPDLSRMLSGHQQTEQLPPPPAASGPWIGSTAATMTAWSGPWGISYTANLTPDPDTGLGQWTEQQFVDTIRNGRHQGRGRQLLPPMPWPAFRNLSDDDLKAIFAYLRTIPAIKNKVPPPTPPAAAPKQ
jgi:mono/diheme cytochrome c family protein